MEQTTTDLKSFVNTMVYNLIDAPKELHVKAVEGEQTLVLEIHVAKTDLGKIIGKKGKNAQSMRTLLSAAATRLGVRAVMEIVE